MQTIRVLQLDVCISVRGYSAGGDKLLENDINLPRVKEFVLFFMEPRNSSCMETGVIDEIMTLEFIWYIIEKKLC